MTYKFPCTECGGSHSLADRAPHDVPAGYENATKHVAAARNALTQHDVLRERGLHGCAAREAWLAATLLEEVRVPYDHGGGS